MLICITSINIHIVIQNLLKLSYFNLPYIDSTFLLKKPKNYESLIEIENKVKEIYKNCIILNDTKENISNYTQITKYPFDIYSNVHISKGVTNIKVNEFGDNHKTKVTFVLLLKPIHILVSAEYPTIKYFKKHSMTSNHKLSLSMKFKAHTRRFC